jgi:hypothetical protein
VTQCPRREPFIFKVVDVLPASKGRSATEWKKHAVRVKACFFRVDPVRRTLRGLDAATKCSRWFRKIDQASARITPSSCTPERRGRTYPFENSFTSCPKERSALFVRLFLGG